MRANLQAPRTRAAAIVRETKCRQRLCVERVARCFLAREHELHFGLKLVRRLTRVQGACVCNWGYVGRACTLLCPGIIGNSAVCSGHGRYCLLLCSNASNCLPDNPEKSCVQANSSAICQCDFGWGGEKCNEMRLYVYAAAAAVLPVCSACKYPPMQCG